MYRYGDGSPFPLDENFIETLTSAVETCTERVHAADRARLAGATSAKEARARRRSRARAAHRAREGRSPARSRRTSSPTRRRARPSRSRRRPSADREAADARGQRAGRERASRRSRRRRRPGRPPMRWSRRCARSSTRIQLPNAKWIMSWDVRGAEPQADAVATAGRISGVVPARRRSLPRADPRRSARRGVIVHMMKKGVFGKAKPAPVDLGKYVMVAFEHTRAASTSSRSRRTRTRPRPACASRSATRARPGSRSPPQATPRASRTISTPRTSHRSAASPSARLRDAQGSDRPPHARRPLARRTGRSQISTSRAIVPLELLAQLTPLARSIRDKSRMSGELVLKRDIGDGRREELFVPRAHPRRSSSRGCPLEYRRPFEDMGITGEDDRSRRSCCRGAPPAPKARCRDDPTNIELDPRTDQRGERTIPSTTCSSITRSPSSRPSAFICGPVHGAGRGRA